MDVLYFLKERTQFIRKYYETASEPFREIMRKIEAGEAPFVPERYFREDEPPFLEEWSQANTGLQVLGRTCVSMLSASLKLYFQTWESKFSISLTEQEKCKMFKRGFLKGYKKVFSKLPNIEWTCCPVDFDILEQIILARIDEQHPECIVTMNVQHDPNVRKKFPLPFFLSEHEKEIFAMPNIPALLQPDLHVSWEQLREAIKQVEALGDWLEDRMFAAWKSGAHG